VILIREGRLEQLACSCGVAKVPMLPVEAPVPRAPGDSSDNARALSAHEAGMEDQTLVYGHHLDVLQTCSNIISSTMSVHNKKNSLEICMDVDTCIYVYRNYEEVGM
jgi:hypothetical protein